MIAAAAEPIAELGQLLGRCARDPLAFVLAFFPWGVGDLKNFSGPLDWQREILAAVRDGLKTPGEAIQIAVSSGHGIGKSALVAWLIHWAIATRENTRGVVTANTENQLKTKTWAELAKWFRLFLARIFFTHTATAIFSKNPEYEKTWRIDMLPWSEHSTEAFAGLHNEGGRALLIFDEASAIPDTIWKVSEGVLTNSNTELLWFAFGNPTRNTGGFHDCFNRLAHRWKKWQIDSRTVPVTNQEQIKKWVEDYGEDSDFVRVRVRGIFPSTSDRQFIGSGLVEKAMKITLQPGSYEFAPKIIGVDPAIYGDDEAVIYIRQGLWSKRLASYRKIGDDFKLAGYVAGFQDEYKADAVFVDAGMGTGVISAGRQLGREWSMINFGSSPDKPEYLNKRAEMWAEMKTWIKQGGFVEPDPVIREQLSGPEYTINAKGKLQLESKDDMRRRGLSSPDRADALALTFAAPVAKLDSSDECVSDMMRRSR